METFERTLKENNDNNNKTLLTNNLLENFKNQYQIIKRHSTVMFRDQGFC